MTDPDERLYRAAYLRRERRHAIALGVVYAVLIALVAALVVMWS